MSKHKEYLDLETVTIRLRRGDKDVLAGYFPKEGYNRVIRELVAKFTKQLQSIQPTTEQELTNDLPNIELPADFLSADGTKSDILG